MSIVVNCRAKTISIQGQTYPCRIGRKGFVPKDQGREGDEKTPLGHYQVRFGMFREDRLPSQPPGQMTWRALKPDDGWCDDINDPAYNRFVRLPFSGSHEKLWREDGAYDIILILNHNDEPPQKNMGSAVFIHVAQIDERETLGCVALDPNTMIKLTKQLRVSTDIEIKA